MNQNNPHLITLEIMWDIINAPTTMESLTALTNLSPRQVMRHIEEARHLGAQIESSRKGRYSRFSCKNSEQIIKADILRKWLEIERARQVI